MHHGAMRDADSLRRSGRSGGVDHVGAALRIDCHRRRHSRLPRDRRLIAVQAHQAVDAAGLEPRAQSRLRHQHRRKGVRQHEGKAIVRVGRIERQIGAARLEDAEHPHDQLRRALHAQPHHRLRSYAQRTKVMRQLIGPPIERAVAQALLPAHHRHRIGATRGLSGEQLRQRHRRRRDVHAFAIAQQGGAFRRR